MDSTIRRFIHLFFPHEYKMLGKKIIKYKRIYIESLNWQALDSFSNLYKKLINCRINSKIPEHEKNFAHNKFL